MEGMSEIAISGQPTADSAFRRGNMLLIVAIGVAAFFAMLVLGAYAPDMRSGRNGGAHALSNAATGFSGIVALARATGRNPQVVRNEAGLDTADLVVLTPETGRTNLDPVLTIRRGRPTLVVLPKWQTVADPVRSGWVRSAGLKHALEVHSVLAPAHRLKVERQRSRGQALATVEEHAPELHFTAPGPLQTVTAEGWTPIV